MGNYDFTSIAGMADVTIQRMLRKIENTDLITALVDADDSAKETVYRNMSGQAGKIIRAEVSRLEQDDSRKLIIERSRNIIGKALLEAANE